MVTRRLGINQFVILPKPDTIFLLGVKVYFLHRDKWV